VVAKGDFGQVERLDHGAILVVVVAFLILAFDQLRGANIDVAAQIKRYSQFHAHSQAGFARNRST